MICLNTEGCIKDAIEKVFHTWIKDYDTFFHILRTRGFYFTEKMKPELAEKCVKEVLYLGDKEVYPNYVKIYAKITTVEDNNNMFLKVQVFKDKKMILSFLIGKNYFYMGEKKDDVKSILKKIDFCIYDQRDLEIFATRYPEYKISEFIENGGKNILVPLMAERFDYYLELLIKANCMTIADNFYFHEEDVRKHQTDFVDIFRVPAKILRKLSSDASEYFHILTILEKTRMLAPDFLQQVDIINDSLIVFFANNLLRCDERRAEIYEFNELSKRQKLRMVRYVNTLSRTEYIRFYVDYINMCTLIQEPFRVDPKGDICELHDHILKVYLEKMDKVKMMKFENKINNIKYRELETKNEKEGFLIMSPESIDDVYREGREMSNCVGTYVSRIIDGSSQILFLRRTSNPKEAFGTIEVRENKLYQAKGKYNQCLSKEAQKFVRRWCEEKGLGINTMDINIRTY